MEHRRYTGITNQPEAALCQILQEAQNRWLRPTEVCEILRNYRKFKLTPDPPHKPQSGSLFLFDRKAIRYFRKDGHNWRKKKDGKTVREAHERLKAGSVEVLHCYYAHGEENENFQRRSYWMLDTNEHIVLVHYRQVKEGSRSGLRSPNSYSIDGSSAFGNSRGIPGTSPQTSPLVSPRSSSPNNSTADWNGRQSFSPECEEPESSDDTDQFRHREMEAPNSSANRGPGVIGNSENFACFQSPALPLVGRNGGPYGEKVMAFSYGGSNGTQTSVYTSTMGPDGPQASLLKQGSGSVSPPGGLDLLEYGELLNNRGGKATMESMSGRVIGRPDQFKDKALTAEDCSSWFKDPTRVARSITAGDSKLLAEGTSWQPSSQNFFDASSITVSKQQQLFPEYDSKSLQDLKSNNLSVATNWNVLFSQLGDSSAILGGNVLDGLKNNLLNDSDQAQNVFPPAFHDNLIPQNNTDRFDTAAGVDMKDSPLIPPYSSLFRDFPADIPTQHEDQDAFKKYESYGRWPVQDVGGDVMLPTASESAYWASAFADVPGLTQQMQLEIGGPSSAVHQIHFSITDFAPSCAHACSETKVLISGNFGDKVKVPSLMQWSCMFGDVEVPAEHVQCGVLRCNAPPLPAGKVTFCVTQSDKVACSEIKEFEYYEEHTRCALPCASEVNEASRSSKIDMLFQIRLAKMLSNESVLSSLTSFDMDQLSEALSLEMGSLGRFDEWENMEVQFTESGYLGTSLKDQFVQKLLKEKLQIWLLRKIQDGGKGASVWDSNGLGVLHIGAALGYSWIIAPTTAAGVNINFRDSRGWTALHWAAHCGREAMVVALMANNAAPGAKTDPSTKFPGGQTPADLASAEHHKGIAGYLAESSLTSHLSALTLKSKTSENSPAIDDGVESPLKKSVVQPLQRGADEQLSLKDTFAAVRNATQAAAKIHLEFRVESFRKKQESYQLETDEYGISNEEVQYLVAAQKSSRSPSRYDDDLTHIEAATRIQRKFRGWKGRQNFLLYRQNVVKIQAHFRGHQVRKQYKKIIWSVSILEKAILRWRRKGRGLRGFESVAWAENIYSKNDEDTDFLKAGRKQIEAGLEKAIARVQSMARSPEAQEQYHRLVEGFQKTKAHLEGNYGSTLMIEGKEQL